MQSCVEVDMSKPVFRVRVVLYAYPPQTLRLTLVCTCVLLTVEAGMNAAVSPNHGGWRMLGPTLKTSALARLYFQGWVRSLQLSLKSRCYSTLKTLTFNGLYSFRDVEKGKRGVPHVLLEVRGPTCGI